MVARRDEARVRRGDRGRLGSHIPDARLPRRCRGSDPGAGVVGLEDGVAGPVTWSPDGDSLVVVGWAGEPVGHARLLRLRSTAAQPEDLAAPLDRNVMPGGPAYPGGLPTSRATTGRCSSASGTAAALISIGPVRRWGSRTGPRGRRPVRERPLGRGANRRADTRDAHVVRRAGDGRPRDPEAVLTEHGASLEGIELYERVEREFTISDDTVVTGGSFATRTPRRPSRCSSTSTAGHTTPGTARRTSSTSTTRSSRRAAGRSSS